MDSCRVGSFWRAERAVECFRCRWKTWPLLLCSGPAMVRPLMWQHMVPGIMVFGAVTKLGTRECSGSNGPDRLGP